MQWDNEDGWQLTATRSCVELVNSSPRRAVYCSWFGITCCDAAAIAAGNCTARDTIQSIMMPINNLNASVNNPAMIQPLLDVHACGLKAVNLEANNLVGRLSDLWGRMVNMTLLNLGKFSPLLSGIGDQQMHASVEHCSATAAIHMGCSSALAYIAIMLDDPGPRPSVVSVGNCWIDGSIPSSLRRLRKLRFINLSNNWLNGTLPSWIDELQELQVLNFGSQFGENAGSDSVGLMGTIPKQIGFLRQLQELNLETNALTGTLPSNLCSGGEHVWLQHHLMAPHAAWYCNLSACTAAMVTASCRLIRCRKQLAVTRPAKYNDINPFVCLCCLCR